MGRTNIEDILYEMEDFINSCKTTALSSNKVIVPRDEFDELFGELKVRIPAEIERCKKIMRNKDAILIEARTKADSALVQAAEQANQMVSETQIVELANQKAYEIIEEAKLQANNILSEAAEEANEIRLGSMQYTNDVMFGIRNYVEATLEAERANYENLLQMLNNEYTMADANLEEVQKQIVEFTGNPDSVVKPPKMKQIAAEKTVGSKIKKDTTQKVKQIVEKKEEKRADEPKKETKVVEHISDVAVNREEKKVMPKKETIELTATEKSVLKKEKEVKSLTELKKERVNKEKPVKEKIEKEKAPVLKEKKKVVNKELASKETTAKEVTSKEDKPSLTEQKERKKIVRKRNPVLHTPQTAQETVKKTLEAAAAMKPDRTVYKANGEQAREIPLMEGKVKRGPRVGRGMVENQVTLAEKDAAQKGMEVIPGKSLGVIDDFSSEE